MRNKVSRKEAQGRQAKNLTTDFTDFTDESGIRGANHFSLRKMVCAAFMPLSVLSVKSVVETLSAPFVPSCGHFSLSPILRPDQYAGLTRFPFSMLCENGRRVGRL